MRVTVHDTVTVATTGDVTVEQFERFLERYGWHYVKTFASKAWSRGTDTHAPTIYTSSEMADWRLVHHIENAARELGWKAAEVLAAVAKEPA